MKTYIYGKVWRANNKGGLSRSLMLGAGATPTEARDIESQGVRPDPKDILGCVVYEVVSGQDLVEEAGDFAEIVLEKDVVFWAARGNGMENVVVVMPANATAV